MSTSIDNSATTNTNGKAQAAIGEKVTYSVTITVPQGTTPGAQVIDTLPAGLGFVQLDSTSFSPGLSSSNGAAPTITINGTKVTFNFGTLTDSDTNPSTPETVTFTYDTVVKDIASNTAGVTLTNSAQVSWNDGIAHTSGTGVRSGDHGHRAEAGRDPDAKPDDW